MDQQLTAYGVIALWLLCGGAFFIKTGIHSGWPTRWRSDNSREPDWLSLTTFYLPIMLVLGPLMWVGFLYFRRKN